MAGAKKVISKAEWEKKLNDITISKTDLNQLVMNYLVIEGYKEAAECFAKESDTTPDVNLEQISDRMAIRSAIQTGDIDSAISRVNDLDPEILDTNPQIYFHLQQQRLIELIRENKIDEALQFAQEELAPRGEENPRFLEDLEKTMALLVFQGGAESPLGELLDNTHRQKTASELNAAILSSQCQEKDPKLPSMLKMLLWAQKQLDEKVKFPHIENMVTAELSES
eukprot:GFYU01002434.1.p1 GENE.GFYU01002434.1~~GFYU01002434.1.p1  ORF type:complete len:225 (+),score=77.40 GFYU01002434.1:69-743(+)